MDAAQIETLFTRSDGSFAFARWGRPVCPIVFGVDDATLAVVKGAIEATCQLAGHEMGEMDAELGSNLMMFFFSDWAELIEVPGMDRLVPDLDQMVARLQAADANQYRFFRFDEAGAIKACFVFLRMDDHLADVPAQTLALSQIVQSMLLWSDEAFQDQSPLAMAADTTVLRPDVAALIRAAYDPVLPHAAQCASHALRLAARMGAVQ
ncbi:hypothetical protein JQT66_16095 [Sulfitobacter mediterraneus]|nr:hypothetical protein [Sulfitobacter mediterraneus]MBM1311762.1 hypothetical protein [Sulfitobacter mediterraneus]MBM1315644.1 hypothetical protein [Sulfitobacter mediterraneus]MBM1324005.1 hypothetical protein [Sulfitobacter mediterraneus]MBM1327917.1 hypothetical protein [Sulfitobacter mediterraneus]MBM1399265.1 hypothetical protein [Sulfitobacter mediterraneus]